MKRIQFFYQQSAGLSTDEVVAVAQRLQPEIARLSEARDAGYNSLYASINLSSDEVLRQRVHELVAEKKKLGIVGVVIVGIGGSSLGTRALFEALCSVYHNELSSGMHVYFLETVDPDTVHDTLQLVERLLQQGKKVLCNVVTKSGTTTETIANFALVRELFKKYYAHDYAQYIVATTDKGSALWHEAQRNNYALLEVPAAVGGRFSVLSAVGLFPAALLGISGEQLHEGARGILTDLLSGNVAHNPAALSASIKYILYKQHNVNIDVMFVFCQKLRAFAAWYAQLMGESIGKAYDVDGALVHCGITPVASVGTTDLHSVGQLYLGGPYDKLITFCSLDTSQHEPSMARIMQATLRGVKQVYLQERRPFVELVIPRLDAVCMGQLLQLYMVEIMYLGFLLRVNPFDQPSVELYKKETRKILSDD